MRPRPAVQAACALAAALVLAVAVLLPGVEHDPRRHALQHLLLSGVAPLLLACAAPVTAALRALPVRPRRALVGLLHSRAARVLTWLPLVVAVEVVTPYVLYLTPLLERAERVPPLHALVHLHVVLAGWLFAAVLAGPDPLPGRPRVRTRLAALLVAAAAHDVLCKVLYARADSDDARAAAQLMYSGAGATELALAVVLLAGWWARTGRELRRAERRAGAACATVPG